MRLGIRMTSDAVQDDCSLRHSYNHHAKELRQVTQPFPLSIVSIALYESNQIICCCCCCLKQIDCCLMYFRMFAMLWRLTVIHIRQSRCHQVKRRLFVVVSAGSVGNRASRENPYVVKLSTVN